MSYQADAELIADAIVDLGMRADAEVAALKAQIPEPQPPEPEPTPAFMKVGSSLYRESGETYDQAFQRRATNWGAEPELVRYFYSNYPTGDWPKFGKSQIVASFKPTNINDFVAGNYDSVFNKWFDELPQDGVPKRISPWHEEEDDIERGAFTFEQAKRMDKKFKDLATAANKRNPGSNIRVGKVFMAWTLDSRSGRNIDNYLPTDWDFDWLGWDAYAGDSASLDLPNLTYTKALFTRCKDATTKHGTNSWFICETGTRNHNNVAADVYDGMQAEWITGAIGIAAQLGCRGFMYFDSTVGGDFRIKGPKGFAAMGNAIKK